MMSDGEKFETLLPKKDVDLSSYESALNHAMNSDEIRNIALSGSYGSGKSSVIRSYESMKNDRKFLHISLARFTEEVNEKLKKADTAEEKDENGEEPGGGGQGKKIGEQKPKTKEKSQKGSRDMLRKKTSLIIEHRTELEAKREELQERQERAHEEILKSIDELNALFLPHSSDVYLIDGDPVDPDWSRTEVVKKILSAELIEYHRGSQEVSELQQEMESNAEYQSRKKSVEDGEENKKKELDREIKRIDIDLRLLNTRKLYEVLTDENNVWQLDVPFTDVTSNPAFDLLKYLIWNGYIDEDYSIYVSFFYPNSLTVRDRNFLLPAGP